MKISTIIQLREWGITILRVGTGVTFLLHDGEMLFYKLFDLGELLSIRGGEVVLECLCAAALVLGLFTRMVSVVLAMGMLVDVLFIEQPSNFFSRDVGFEYALLRLTASFALVLLGPGRAALSDVPALQKVPVIARLRR